MSTAETTPTIDPHGTSGDTETPPSLEMWFHPKSGCYVIRNTQDDHALQFPESDRVQEIWENVFPRTRFFISSSIDHPVPCFWAQVGPGTKSLERQRFCNALAAECSFGA